MTNKKRAIIRVDIFLFSGGNFEMGYGATDGTDSFAVDEQAVYGRGCVSVRRETLCCVAAKETNKNALIRRRGPAIHRQPLPFLLVLLFFVKIKIVQWPGCDESFLTKLVSFACVE